MSKAIARLLVILIGLPLLLDGVNSFAGTAATNQMVSGDRMFGDYFKAETAKLSNASLSNIHTLSDWKSRRPELRREAAEMLGLDPMPDRTPLQAVVTGKLEQPDFTVEKLCFQSEPHLYVTANLYLPKSLTNPAPTVLYLCGHLPVISNSVSYGNKTAYQHHGIWFARNGYVCLIIDTLQYGEILGHHRGTFDENQWWWNSRGYTPAGVETWNAIRALDYLSTRPEVDTNRMAVTGRSGGGAYSWFLAALDDRVKVVAPVAGITDLQNYLVDGAVDQHCDCMFLVNNYRWDYPLLAALCAPRPLLLANSDADSLFPLDGVMRTRNFVKHIYDLYGATTNFGLVIGPGPHKDTQNLQIPVFRWFNLYLKNQDPLINMAAVKMFSPAELKVLDKIPDDQINTTIQNNFVPVARTPEIPKTADEWKTMQQTWMDELRTKCFAGWPDDAGPPQMKQLLSETNGGIRYEKWEFQSHANVLLPIYLARKDDASLPQKLVLLVADSSFTNGSPDEAGNWAPGIQEMRRVLKMEGIANGFDERSTVPNVPVAIFFPRGVGPTAIGGGNNQLVGLRRRFMLLGQTLDGMRVWDIQRAVEGLRTLHNFEKLPLQLEAKGNMGVNCLYASLFASGVDSLNLRQIPARQRDGPDYLNVLKVLDIPEAAAMVAGRCELELQSDQTDGWNFLREMTASPVAKLNLEWVK